MRGSNPDQLLQLAAETAAGAANAYTGAGTRAPPGAIARADAGPRTRTARNAGAVHASAGTRATAGAVARADAGTRTRTARNAGAVHASAGTRATAGAVARADAGTRARTARNAGAVHASAGTRATAGAVARADAGARTRTARNAGAVHSGACICAGAANSVRAGTKSTRITGSCCCSAGAFFARRHVRRSGIHGTGGVRARQLPLIKEPATSKHHATQRRPDGPMHVSQTLPVNAAPGRNQSRRPSVESSLPAGRVNPLEAVGDV